MLRDRQVAEVRGQAAGARAQGDRAALRSLRRRAADRSPDRLRARHHRRRRPTSSRQQALRAASPAKLRARGAARSSVTCMDMDRLFGSEPAPSHGSGRASGASAPGAPLATRMRPRTLDEFVGQEQLLGGRLGAAARDRGGPPALDDPPRAAGHRQDDARADRRRGLGRRVRGGERGRGGARRGARRDRARARAAAEIGRSDDLLPRRDPPLQQGPAGRAAAGRRGRPGDADRRHHREPVLRGQLGAAVAHAGVRARGARTGGRPDAARSGRRARRGGDAAPIGPRRSTFSPSAQAATLARR